MKDELVKLNQEIVINDAKLGEFICSKLGIDINAVTDIAIECFPGGTRINIKYVQPSKVLDTVDWFNSE